jgi:protein-tyrosine phosphatase
MSDRVHPFAGIHNFRDYGGYDTPEGRLRTGLLFRSGQHGAATQDDLSRFAGMGIATIIDLRGDGERRTMPCARPTGFSGDILFAPGETAGTELAPHEEAGRGIASADEARAAMTELYRNMPFRPVLVASMRLYFEALATRDGPTLIHCLAGKDRTGLAVALLHALLGVHADDIMADYLLTNTAGDPQARIAAAAPSIRERYGAQLSEEAIVALMSVDARYLDTALATIADRHGDVPAYAEAMLGVDAARRAAIRERLVA